MKKVVILALFALAFIVPQAKADTWTSKYLVDKATSESTYATSGAEDSDGNYWFANGSTTGDPNNNNLYEYTTNGTWVDQTNAVNSLVTDSNKGKGFMYGDKSGNLWMVVGGTLLKHNSSGWSSMSPSDISQAVYGSSSGGFINNVFGDTDGNLYVIGRLAGHDSVVKRTPEGNWSEAFSGGPSLSDSNAWVSSSKGFYDKNTNSFWFYISGSPYGIFRYSGGNWTVFTTADGLPDNTPYDMIMGTNGNVWALFDDANTATTSKGLTRFDGSSWTTYVAANSGLTTGILKQLSEDSEGRIWATTIHGENDATVVSGINPATNTWSYYSVRNSMDQLRGINRLYFFTHEFWASTEGSNSIGFLIGQDNNLQVTLYGQTGGTIVSEASFKMLKKKSSTKKVMVYKMTKKKKKWKQGKAVYRGKTSGGWYKALNLPVGRYKVKVGNKAKTIQITSGDPYRLNFK